MMNLGYSNFCLNNKMKINGYKCKFIYYDKNIKNLLFRYVNSFYFVILNATSVGYGNEYLSTSQEKTFVIFLQFAAICIFSIITGNISSLKG